MSDLKIDPATDDITITQGAPETVTGRDTVSKAQRIRARLLTVRGEWLTDVNFGLDYYGVIWVKGTSQAVLTAHVQREIMQEADPGDKITRFDLDYDGTTRTLSVEATLTAADGSETTITT